MNGWMDGWMDGWYMKQPELITMVSKPNRKLLPDHLSSILHDALVGAGSTWPLIGVHSTGWPQSRVFPVWVP
jgi:hypothetical protein